MENNYLILGIDPGLNFTGWGIVESLSNKENHISHGVIKTTKTFIGNQNQIPPKFSAIKVNSELISDVR